MTALVIIITGQSAADPETRRYLLHEGASTIQNMDGNKGVTLTSAAFSSTFGWFRYVLALAVSCLPSRR